MVQLNAPATVRWTPVSYVYLIWYIVKIWSWMLFDTLLRTMLNVIFFSYNCLCLAGMSVWSSLKLEWSDLWSGQRRTFSTIYLFITTHYFYHFRQLYTNNLNHFNRYPVFHKRLYRLIGGYSNVVDLKENTFSQTGWTPRTGLPSSPLVQLICCVKANVQAVFCYGTCVILPHFKILSSH